MREKIGKQMLQTSVRKIEYDFMACTGKLFQDFGYCDMSECIAYIEKIDPAVIRIQTYCGGEKDILFSVGWQMTGHARRAGRPRSKIIAHAQASYTKEGQTIAWRERKRRLRETAANEKAGLSPPRSNNIRGTGFRL
jgi:hypothetical protein